MKKTESALEKNINVVFGFYLNPKSNWKAILSGQLNDLKRYQLLAAAKLHIIITNPHNTEGAENIIRNICGSTPTILTYAENAYEYWALKYAWDLANSNPNGQLAYLHSKGISYDIEKRTRFEKTLTRETFQGWRKITRLLDDKAIRKVGLFPSTEGWIWFNFWWTTAHYITTLPEPIISTDRYTHESWLHRTSAPLEKDCFSLYSGAVGNFDVDETNAKMKALTKSAVLQIPALRRLALQLKKTVHPLLQRQKNS
ncbi:hypothetical protein DNK06_00855 [Pseudomonas daroniae]|uniref:Uncharacterized protein n=1 Tax=Phytopseudomonas daroniae TaxID=2487519 RepID=A0A4Q9QSA0_9GAMM|nr:MULTISPECIES: hypothetical protein [Pseudomonas]TBU83012.1 hypothetical protein DNK31_10100 [Pseudomonas sp. FRB 228]TBU83975.1 hypothetical protein DNK06_00855 [Pseudomonas daroniae]TBU93153.1 hypothetical protein DNJ99_06765 [Pseudomonas daroniae]